MLTSPGQEKPLSTLQRSHGPLENFQTAAFTVQPYSSLFTPETAPPLICALGAYGSMYEEVWGAVLQLGCLHGGAAPSLAWSWPRDIQYRLGPVFLYQLKAEGSPPSLCCLAGEHVTASIYRLCKTFIDMSCWKYRKLILKHCHILFIPLWSTTPVFLVFFFTLFSRHLLTIYPLFPLSHPYAMISLKLLVHNFYSVFVIFGWFGFFITELVTGTFCCALGLHLQPVLLLWHLFPVTLPPLPVLYNRVLCSWACSAGWSADPVLMPWNPDKPWH